MAAGVTYDLSDDYPPDRILIRMGFRQRVYLEQFASLPCIFGCAHFTLSCQLSSFPVMRKSLETFDNYTRDAPADTRNAAEVILRSCSGGIPELLTEEIFATREFVELMAAYTSVYTYYVGDMSDRKAALSQLSHLFYVSSLLFVHNESDVVCEFVVQKEEAPLVRIENMNEVYCWYENDATSRLVMRPGEIIEWVRPIADPEMLDYYTKEQQSEAVEPPKAEPEPSHSRSEDVTGLRQVAEWQASVLAYFMDWAPREAVASLEHLGEVQTLAVKLGISPEPYKEIARKMTEIPEEHPWEECEYCSANITELPCGHRLCDFHRRQVQSCPWHCPS